MTQDPWGQPRPGDVVRGEVVQDNESSVPQDGEARPLTHFQKVASAVRADEHEPPEQAASQEGDEARTEDEVRAVSSPDAGRGDYWDDEDVSEVKPAEDLAAEPAEGPASWSAVTADPEAGPSAPAKGAEEVEEAEGPTDEAGPDAQEAEGPTDEAGPDTQEAEGPTDEAGPDTRDATDHAMTEPDLFGAPRPVAAEVPTVPIALGAQQPNGDTGRQAAPAAGAELRPGESGTTLGLGESGYASLIADTADLRTQWHQIQYRFVDDPKVSVTEAADVIAQVATRLEAAIAERQRGLRARWDTTGTVDTETLRETLRMYRSFLDHLIGPEPS